MLEEYEKSQPIAYKILTNSVKKNKISHAYLIESNGYSKKLDFAKAFSKFLLCKNNYTTKNKCANCSICHRIDTNNFTELKIIEPDGMWIKKEQLENLQNEFSKKSIEADKKIYIIDGAEKMNSSAANSILKFLEEPEPNIIAILITDNIYQLMNTIKSRCQIVSLKNDNKINIDSSNDYQQIVSKIISNDTSSLKNIKDGMSDEQYFVYVTSVIKFINTYEHKKRTTLLEVNELWNKIFTDREKIFLGLEIMTFFYKDVLNRKLERNIEIFIDKKDMIEEIAIKNSQKQICDKIKIILNAKQKIKYNVNNNLLMDKLLLDLEEVAYGKSS